MTRAFRAATPEQRAHGVGWYRAARELAEALDPTDVERAAAVIAVLSPRQSWGRNAQLAEQAYRVVRHVASFAEEWSVPSEVAEDITEALAELPTMGDQRRKVTRLLVDGEDPDTVVSGPKVRAFWRTIVDPADPRTVVIDRHAIDVTVGRMLDDKQRGALVGRKGAYDALAGCYVRAARILSVETGTVLSPAEVQAVTWHYWRQTHSHFRRANGGAK